MIYGRSQPRELWFIDMYMYMGIRIVWDEQDTYCTLSARGGGDSVVVEGELCAADDGVCACVCSLCSMSP